MHIPKTGGNSITAALRSAWARKPLSERLVVRIRLAGKGPAAVRRFHKHAKARDIHAVVGEHAWHDHFSFAVVRNPWDLMVSSYHWWLNRADRWKSLQTDAQAVAALGSFPRFVDSPYGRERINEQLGNFRDWICDAEGRVLIDNICRFERLEEDWQGIATQLGIQVDLPHLNRGNRVAYRDYYDGPSKQIIAERFAWAIDCFEYRY
ncbi:MAG: sulfotransferase family 2 domain-containing protein [Gemmatimonadales bacterium]|nr:sulfotransferase family 2 domain-containing protein [Gemmatimonadales bacterium]